MVVVTAGSGADWVTFMDYCFLSNNSNKKTLLGNKLCGWWWRILFE
jgi:hypothetical protein